MNVRMQRFLSTFTAFVISLGLLVFSASATTWEGIVYDATNFWDFITTGSSDFNIRDHIGAYTGGTWQEKYADMVDKMITGLGTDKVGKDGVVIQFAASSVSGLSANQLVEFVPGTRAVLAFKGSNTGCSVHYVNLIAPFAGTYHIYRSYSGSRNHKDLLMTYFYNPGEKIVDFRVDFYRSVPLVKFYLDVYAEVEPYNYVGPDGFVADYGGSSSRPGNLDTSKGTNVKIGMTAEDGSVSVLGNVGSLFNEKNTTFYNPQTKTYEVANNWMYDYSDRSYTFDTDNSGTGKVVYGDDTAAVTLKDSNGNIINYNFNYMLGEGVTPSAPDGGGSSGDGGGGGGIFDKLGKLLGSILNGITTIIGAAIEKVLDGLIALVDSIVAKLGEVVTSFLGILDELPKMLSGFTTFLSSAFSFLPPEITTILTFGILAVVLVGVLKLFLK